VRARTAEAGGEKQQRGGGEERSAEDMGRDQQTTPAKPIM